MDDNEREETVPYQFEVPESIHAEVMAKAEKAGVKVAPLMRMAFEQIAERPISESLQLLEQHNDRHTKHRRKNK